jgi:branched-chain amino acid transport system ATP-binding protein
VQTALSIKDLAVTYAGGIQGLRSVSLDVPEGAMVALLGANGAGKTTTLRAVSGLLELEGGKVTAGSIEAFGTGVHGVPPHKIVRRGIFHAREGRHVFADMSVEDNLVAATFATTGRSKADRNFDEVYGYFPRLAERRKQMAGYLSGGEQQMLVLGRALVADPRLVLLDEPSLGLAPKIVHDIFEIIASIKEKKKLSVLVVEQNAAIALKYASYGYVIENGRIAASGTAEDLLEKGDMKHFYLGGSHLEHAHK